MYVSLYVCMYVCMYVYMHERVRDWLCMYVGMGGWMDGWVDGCVSMHACMHVCMYVCTRCATTCPRALLQESIDIAMMRDCRAVRTAGPQSPMIFGGRYAHPFKQRIVFSTCKDLRAHHFRKGTPRTNVCMGGTSPPLDCRSAALQ